jgi:predicted house-cleaning noncanonical NTP pyrophosphatase (MazG superfamily)
VRVLFSDDVLRADWSEAKQAEPEFGVKGASALALPRAWTPPFAVISVELISSVSAEVPLSSLIEERDLTRIRGLAGDGTQIIVRSSVVGESIWERGSYLSLPVETAPDNFVESFDRAALQVVLSAPPKKSGLMVQRFISPASQGEFGNLQRISKTRDQWEISATDRTGSITNLRLNSQRDPAADPDLPILARSGITQERLFGPIASWLNNELLRGKSQRLTCEWLTDNRQFYLVQIDEEDEDLWGINPFQLRVLPSPRSIATDGTYFKLAAGDALKAWDKLKVLEELWEDGASHKPILFYVRLSDLPKSGDALGLADLERDFHTLFGPTGIVVRTSVAASQPKLPNLPRTECLTPASAVEWCIESAEKLAADHDLSALAFVAHRFVAARAAAWARADPEDPIVEIHSLWGLPDVLQYCPYDIWEVHVPTRVATDYPEYKSDMLIATDDGGWRHDRVKNEVARSNSINSTEARDLAARSIAIADRLGRACHIMWFVGCADQDGSNFNMPWYWTEAHEAEHNNDRATYSVITVTDQDSLKRFSEWEGPRTRQALALKPTDLNLMRDTKFITRVGETAKAANVPIILSGSTLAHAYYQLRMLGCAVVTPTKKERSRIRRTANLGKLVRDKIPTRIAERREFEITRQIPVSLMKGFLVSKLLEEALEVREAVGSDQKREELADLYEVVRALAKSEGFEVAEIEQAADRKREKVAPFPRRPSSAIAPPR